MSILNNENISDFLKKKIRFIEKIFKGKKILVAFSGGIDSTLVLYLANKFGKTAKGVLIHSPLTPTAEINNAHLFSDILKIPMIEYEVNMLNLPELRKNLPNRCYYCKKEILKIMNEISVEKDCDLIVDGTNYSDLGLYRPGLIALKESDVRSPLAEAEITKSEIISLSQILSLPSKNISSQACLASRIPFNMEITQDLLAKIDKAEQFLRKKIKDPKAPIRVRIHELSNSNKLIARIESNKKLFDLISITETRSEINEYLKKLGFIYVTIDLSGFKSGSMDKLVKKD